MRAGRIQLAVALANPAPPQLRKELDGLLDDIQRTFPLWDTSKWSASPPAR